MSAYIDAGYVAALGSLAVYGSTLVARERALRRRLGTIERPDDEDLVDGQEGTPGRTEEQPEPSR